MGMPLRIDEVYWIHPKDRSIIRPPRIMHEADHVNNWDTSVEISWGTNELYEIVSHDFDFASKLHSNDDGYWSLPESKMLIAQLSSLGGAIKGSDIIMEFKTKPLGSGIVQVSYPNRAERYSVFRDLLLIFKIKRNCKNLLSPVLCFVDKNGYEMATIKSR